MSETARNMRIIIINCDTVSIIAAARYIHCDYRFFRIIHNMNLVVCRQNKNLFTN